MTEIPVHLWVAAGGLLLGFAFGFSVQRSDFCMMGAVADIALKGDARRMRAWLLAMAVAVLGTQFLQLTGVVDLAPIAQLVPVLPWLGIVLGGLLFGFGMVLGCGCPSRSAVNAASGDLRALVTLLVIGVLAGMTLRGITAPPRVWLNAETALHVENLRGAQSQGLVELTHTFTGFSEDWLRLVLAAVISAVVLAFCLNDPEFRQATRLWLAGIVLGLLVVAGWLVTGVIGADEFEPTPLASLTFVRPVSDGILYLMTFTGASIDFGVATLAGVLLGACVAALTGGTFRLRGFEDLYEMSRYLVGGALMGFGGVMALGCTVGQGISGVSTLSVGSIVAVLSIISGGLAGARFLEQGSLWGALRAMLGRA